MSCHVKQCHLVTWSHLDSGGPSLGVLWIERVGMMASDLLFRLLSSPAQTDALQDAGPKRKGGSHVEKGTKGEDVSETSPIKTSIVQATAAVVAVVVAVAVAVVSKVVAASVQSFQLDSVLDSV